MVGEIPVGALVDGNKTIFKVWAPQATAVALLIESAATARAVPMARGSAGFHTATAPVGPGTRYRFALDGGPPYPDPASRFQPDGPHGPSEVIDPRAFDWSDRGWTGPEVDDLVVYEMHVGTFTEAGTWQAAARHLEELRDVGVTAIEMMPVAEFPGRFGWGYDGVDFFAPTRLYGWPDDFRTFVDRAHALGLAVILDVVYNHAGPDGCYLEAFSKYYFSSRATEWGRPFNFDGESSGPVRDFFTQNARYWIEEFHLDGLRLDATQMIADASNVHIIQDLVTAARAAAPNRRIWISAENEPQHTRLVRPVSGGGFGADAMWNDDFHHSARVAAAGTREAYYTDYAGLAPEFVTAAVRGFLYQGQWYSWQKQPRGTTTDGLPPRAFVTFLENHDQVANSIDGRRLVELTPAPLLRALTAVLLLGPGVPLLFQGQERGSRAPFYYFADHASPLADAVASGRRDFMRQFRSVASAIDGGFELARPNDELTFTRSRLDWSSTDDSRAWLELHASLLRIRRTDPTIRAAGRAGVRAAALGPHAWVVRYGGAQADSMPPRLLVVNLGPALALPVVPEPLLAPPAGTRWAVRWQSEDARFGGSGANRLTFQDAWHLPETSAWLLA